MVSRFMKIFDEVADALIADAMIEFGAMPLYENRLGHCPRCGADPFRVVAVHGHCQCVACGANVEPCCED